MTRSAATFPRPESGCAPSRTNAPSSPQESFPQTSRPPVESPPAVFRRRRSIPGIDRDSRHLESRRKDSEDPSREESQILRKEARRTELPRLPHFRLLLMVIHRAAHNNLAAFEVPVNAVREPEPVGRPFTIEGVIK